LAERAQDYWGSAQKIPSKMRGAYKNAVGNAQTFSLRAQSLLEQKVKRGSL